MGAKDWMVLYADREIASVLRQAPRLDREATRALVARLYPDRRVVEMVDGNLAYNANPSDGHLYAGCFPGLTIICVADVALERPSQLGDRFFAEARGRAVYLHVNGQLDRRVGGRGVSGLADSFSPDGRSRDSDLV